MGADGIRDVTAALTRVEAVRDAVSARLIEQAETAPPDDVECASWARQHLEALRVPAAVAHCVQQAAHGYADALGATLDPAAVIRAVLAVEVASHAFTAYGAFRRTAPFQLLRLGPDVDSPFVDKDEEAVQLVRSRPQRPRADVRLLALTARGSEPATT